MEVTTKTIEAASTNSGWKAASSDASSTEVAAMGLNLLSGVASLPTFYYELSRHGCWPDALSRQAFLARLLIGVSWGAALQHALSRQACLRGCSPESHGMLPCSMLCRGMVASALAGVSCDAATQHALSRQACGHGCCKRVLRVGGLVPPQIEALLQEMREQLQDDKDQLNVGCFAVPVPHFGWYTLGREWRHFFIFS